MTVSLCCVSSVELRGSNSCVFVVFRVYINDTVNSLSVDCDTNIAPTTVVRLMKLLVFVRLSPL